MKSIDNKKVKNNKLRLTEPCVLFNENVKTMTVYTVHADEVGRIDLIADRVYNNTTYSEQILKFNNISNPFSINEGDVLNIPYTDLPFKNWKTIKPQDKSDSSHPIKDQFMDSKRLTVKDQNRIEYLKQKASQKLNGSKEILPPNILKDGEKNMDIEGGTITI
jgi:hypothetical protein